MILKGEALCKSYGEEIILDSTDLEIRSGESVAITGESGSGKSTLISVMGLLLEPDSGSVCLDGTDLLALDDRGRSKIRNSNFGFIFQHTQLIGSVTVFDNVLIPALISQAEQPVSHKLHVLSIKIVGGFVCKDYIGLQQQRQAVRSVAR